MPPGPGEWVDMSPGACRLLLQRGVAVAMAVACVLPSGRPALSTALPRTPLARAQLAWVRGKKTLGAFWVDMSLAVLFLLGGTELAPSRGALLQDLASPATQTTPLGLEPA